MTLFKNKFRIESARLKGYDYTSPGEYFITIDTKAMVEWFGSMEKGVMMRNDIGETVHRLWLTIPQHHHNVNLDEFIVMPNHVHAILVLTENACRDVACDVSTRNESNLMSTISPRRGSLSTIVGSHKSAVAKWCHDNDFFHFQWQPRFHDHIVRNPLELERIREYIRDNPCNWEYEKNSPSGLLPWMD